MLAATWSTRSEFCTCFHQLFCASLRLQGFKFFQQGPFLGSQRSKAGVPKHHQIFLASHGGNCWSVSSPIPLDPPILGLPMSTKALSCFLLFQISFPAPGHRFHGCAQFLPRHREDGEHMANQSRFFYWIWPFVCPKVRKWKAELGWSWFKALNKTTRPAWQNSTVIPMHSRWATVYVSAVQFEYSQFHLPDMVVLGFLKVLSFKTGFHVTHVSFLPCQNQREARNNLFSSWRGGAWFLNVFCEDLPSGLERGTALWCIEYMLVRFERVRMGSKNSWKNNNGIQTHHVFFWQVQFEPQPFRCTQSQQSPRSHSKTLVDQAGHHFCPQLPHELRR